MVMAGAATIDITPPPGLAMAGFAARTEPAIGAHDRLSARALVIDDTAFLAADVLGFDGAMSQRIRDRCQVPADRVILAATHTHGGPATLPGRAGGSVDAFYLARLEAGCIEAIDTAFRNRRPARLLMGLGADPAIGRNRRHAGGPVEPTTPLLRVCGVDGAPIAVLFSYACHPVTLGPDNRLWTADYVHFARTRIEQAIPGTTAIFATGCCGDVNTGHSAAESLTITATSARSFPTAEALGTAIADAALKAPLRQLEGAVRIKNAWVALPYQRRESNLAELCQLWRQERESADPARQTLLHHWIRWAETIAPTPDPLPWYGRVTALHWGPITLIALPGEIFAQTGLDIRARLDTKNAFIISYAESFPGYIPPRREYPHGGYEVDEAHRFIATPATFAPGCAEALARVAEELARR